MNESDPRIILVGSGRMARALARTMPGRIVAVMARDPEGAREVAMLATDASAIESSEGLRSEKFDLLWIATSDRAIEEVSASLAQEREDWSGIAVVHSSGAMPLAVLHHFRERGAAIAALHPNGSFTGEEPIRAGLLWSVSSDGIDDDRIGRLLDGLQPRLVTIDDDHRALYHAAASAAANYSVTLFALAVELYKRSGLSDEDARDVVAGFMHTSIDRSATIGFEKAITGPIVRGDLEVVHDQMQGIARFAPEFLDLYTALALATARAFAGELQKKWEEMFGEMGSE